GRDALGQAVDRRLGLEGLAKRRLVEKIDDSWQDSARERDPSRRHEGHRHVARESGDDMPIELEALRLVPLAVGQRRLGHVLRLVAGIWTSLRQYARAVDAREPRAGNDALAGDAPVRALEMGPEREFLRRDRPEIDMAGLRRHRGKTALGLDQRRD